MPFTPITTEYPGESHHTTALAGTSMTLSIPNSASGVLVQALTQNARFTLDGFTPTASKGFQLKAGDPPLFIQITRGMVLKFIAETAGSILEYEYSA
jgi:hypothetical protein